MKRIPMKRILLITCAIFAFAFPALAQSYNQETLPFPSTFNIATNVVVNNLYVTNATPTAITKATHAVLMPTFKLAGSGTSTVTFYFDESLDGITWTTDTRTIAVTAAGTTRVGKSVNYEVGAMGFIRLGKIANENAEFVTNIVVKVAYKTP